MRRVRTGLGGLVAVALLLTGCGFGASPAPTPTAAPAAAAAPTSAPTVAKPAASPIASPSPSVAASPTAAQARDVTTVYVGNTDGDGVYIRKTPVMSDRLRAYPDGTALAVIGDEVDGDGQHWRHVRTPDGLEGFVPATYTVETQP